MFGGVATPICWQTSFSYIPMSTSTIGVLQMWRQAKYFGVWHRSPYGYAPIPELFWECESLPILLIRVGQIVLIMPWLQKVEVYICLSLGIELILECPYLTLNPPYLSQANASLGCWDQRCNVRGAWGCASSLSPMLFTLQESCPKSRPFCKRVGLSVFRDIFSNSS